MRYGEHIAMRNIVEDDSGRNAIAQVLRKYFEIRLHSGEKIAANTNEALIIDVLKTTSKVMTGSDHLTLEICRVRREEVNSSSSKEILGVSTAHVKNVPAPSN